MVAARRDNAADRHLIAGAEAVAVGGNHDVCGSNGIGGTGNHTAQLTQRGRSLRREIQIQPIVPIRRSAKAGIGNGRVIIIVARAADADEVRARVQGQIQIRVHTKVVVVLRDLGPSAIRVQLVEPQHGIEQAIAEQGGISFRHDFGGEVAGRRHIELIQVNV